MQVVKDNRTFVDHKGRIISEGQIYAEKDRNGLTHYFQIVYSELGTKEKDYYSIFAKEVYVEGAVTDTYYEISTVNYDLNAGVNELVGSKVPRILKNPNTNEDGYFNSVGEFCVEYKDIEVDGKSVTPKQFYRMLDCYEGSRVVFTIVGSEFPTIDEGVVLVPARIDNLQERTREIVQKGEDVFRYCFNDIVKMLLYVGGLTKRKSEAAKMQFEIRRAKWDTTEEDKLLRLVANDPLAYVDDEGNIHATEI